MPSTRLFFFFLIIYITFSYTFVMLANRFQLSSRFCFTAAISVRIVDLFVPLFFSNISLFVFLSCFRSYSSFNFVSTTVARKGVPSLGFRSMADKPLGPIGLDLQEPLGGGRRQNMLRQKKVNLYFYEFVHFLH